MDLFKQCTIIILFIADTKKTKEDRERKMCTIFKDTNEYFKQIIEIESEAPLGVDGQRRWKRGRGSSIFDSRGFIL